MPTRPTCSNHSFLDNAYDQSAASISQILKTPLYDATVDKAGDTGGNLSNRPALSQPYHQSVPIRLTFTTAVRSARQNPCDFNFDESTLTKKSATRSPWSTFGFSGMEGANTGT